MDGKVKLICPQCKAEFDVYRYRVKQAKDVFCSRACSFASKRLPEGERKRRKAASSKRYREAHQKERHEWYLKKKEHYSKLGHENYLRNKDKYIARAKESFKKRKVLYNTNEKRNLWENIKVVKYRKEKAEKDPEWKRRENEKNLARKDEYKEACILNGAAFKGREWTPGEIEFLELNRKKMTTLEMALKLDRTYDGVRSALNRYDIERKNRNLTDLLDKKREEIV